MAVSGPPQMIGMPPPGLPPGARPGMPPGLPPGMPPMHVPGLSSGAPPGMPQFAISGPPPGGMLPQASQAGFPHAQPFSYPQAAPTMAAPRVAPVSGGVMFAPAVAAAPSTSNATAKDWTEHKAPDGRTYFYNTSTKQSSWSKPKDLMTPLELADSTTCWKECTAPSGRKFFYNKDTKQSVWTIPAELQAAREKAGVAAPSSAIPAVSPAAAAAPQQPAVSTAAAPAQPAVTPATTPAPALSSNGAPPLGLGMPPPSMGMPPGVGAPPPGLPPGMSHPMAVRPVPVAPGVGLGVAPPLFPAGGGVALAASAPPPVASVAPAPSAGHIAAASPAPSVVPLGPTPGTLPTAKEAPARDAPTAPTPKVNVSDEAVQAAVKKPLVFANPHEAKEAFKQMLTDVGITKDMSWDVGMKLIIGDERYGALKSLGEKKACFNEYLQWRTKFEREEKRLMAKQWREDFLTMLKESKKIKSTMRFSEIVPFFEKEPRWNAIENHARLELFEDFKIDLAQKEKEAKRTERKENMAAFRKLLEETSSIKVDSQWRKVNEKLEEEPASIALNKGDRLEVFQEYIRDLEKKDVERKQAEKDMQKRQERKNRDNFKAMLMEHVDNGKLTASTRWRDYLPMCKHEDAYHAMCSNSSGSRPRELFEDVVEELAEKYEKQKSCVKDAIKLQKWTMTTAHSLSDFMRVFEGLDGGIAEKIKAISEGNMQAIFDEMMERAKQKEEKEARKKQIALSDLQDSLRSSHSLTASSKWADAKKELEGSSFYKELNDEAMAEKAFDDHVAYLQTRAKEKEARSKDRDRKEDRKEKKRHKDKKRHRDNSASEDEDDSGEERKKRRKKTRKHERSDSEDSHDRRSRRKSRKSDEGRARASDDEDGEIW